MRTVALRIDRSGFSRLAAKRAPAARAPVRLLLEQLESREMPAPIAVIPTVPGGAFSSGSVPSIASQTFFVSEAVSIFRVMLSSGALSNLIPGIPLGPRPLSGGIAAPEKGVSATRSGGPPVVPASGAFLRSPAAASKFNVDLSSGGDTVVDNSFPGDDNQSDEAQTRALPSSDLATTVAMTSPTDDLFVSAP